ncbi:isoprenylcysteine carboxylmethyltransferase family protein [Luteimonas sp. 3794]|uniref:methyltransferase family protein n=1 Tax=Luteimonas sp. 3794 TaxID=2817730 RepID=UPI00285AB7E8|nr:isoprenylcysteine carboxylmethyltransferase family protein [Luteimonas sp. 3794]MDR6991922.1 protein-S-isoprenylcysteine O-methyltransferase Ste14 [Luteimonas sp. 3794]
MVSEPLDIAPRAPWLVRMTSPVQCVLAFAAGAGLQHAFDLPLAPDDIRGALHLTGTLLADAGLVLAVWAFALFARRRTTIIPAHTPAQLLLRGPFRWTRNPIYLAQVLAYVGLALMLDLPWVLVLLPLPVLALQYAIIPFEEGRLRARFGVQYETYQATVPRWL